MSQQTCPVSFLNCTKYPLCSRTCLSQVSIVASCKDSNEYYTRDCTCGKIVGYQEAELVSIFFTRLFECVEEACVGNNDRKDFLKLYDGECVDFRKERIKDDFIPAKFATLTTTLRPTITMSLIARTTTSTITSRSTATQKSTSIESAATSLNQNPNNITPPNATAPSSSPPTTPSSSTSPNTSLITPPNPTCSTCQPRDPLSNEALAGISVGAAVVGIIIASIAAVIAWKQYKFMITQRQTAGHGQSQMTEHRFYWQRGAVEMEG